MTNGYIYTQEDRTWRNNEGRINILELLSTKYGDVHDFDENIFLQKDECDLLVELTYEDIIVGFATYDIFDEVHYVLTGFYVRRDELYSSLFVSQLKSHYQQRHIFSIHEPTRNMIELLIKCEFAVKVNESLVISAIYFNLDTKTLGSCDESSISGDYNIYYANLYDLDMCMSISLSIYNSGSYQCYFTRMQEADKNQYDCQKMREKLDKTYIDNMVLYIIDYDNILGQRLFFLRNNLHNKLEDEKLSEHTLTEITDILDKYSDEGVIDYNQSNNIQKQIIEELKEGDAYPESVAIRLEYLSKYDDEVISDENVLDACPICSQELDYTEIYCMSCGYAYVDLSDVEDDDLDDNIYFHVFWEELSYKYSLHNKREKKNKFDKEYLLDISTYQILNAIRQEEFYEELYYQIKNQYNLEDFDLEEYLEQEGYISYTLNRQTWQRIAHTYKIPQLKAILKQYNQRISGRKAELIDRITENVPLENIKTDNPHITVKGQQFLENNQMLMIHFNYLKDYIYSEYRQFCQENPEEPIEQAIDFLDEHIECAIYKRHHHHLTDSLVIQALLYSEKNDYETALQLTLQRFIIDINMLYLKKEFINFNLPIQDSTAKNLFTLNHLLGHTHFKKTFKQVYKIFDKDKLTIGYDQTMEILSQILRYANINILNTKIRNRYYMEKEVSKPPTHPKDKTRKTILDDFF